MNFNKNHLFTAVITFIITCSLIFIGSYYFYFRHLNKQIPTINIETLKIYNKIEWTAEQEAEIVYIETERTIRDTVYVVKDSIATTTFQIDTLSVKGTANVFYYYSNKNFALTLDLESESEIATVTKTKFLEMPVKFIRPVVSVGASKLGGSIAGGVVILDKFNVMIEIVGIDCDGFTLIPFIKLGYNF